MKKILLAFCCTSLISPMTLAESKTEKNPLQQHQKIDYSAGGFAEVTIERPVNEVFNILTNVNSWPKINQGVTVSIVPDNVVAQKGAKFKESIASPIPEIKNWTTEWTILEFKPNKKFVIAGIEKFAQVPIYSKISYEFEAKDKNSTKFERTIEVSLNEEFKKGASTTEIEALYRFLGSQWEMANHLKHYIENQPK